MMDGLELDVADVYAAQTMCPYETVAYGFSRFCDLFTYEEWVGFGYAVDLNFHGDAAFGSPTGVSSHHFVKETRLTDGSVPLGWAGSRKWWLD